MAEILNLFGTLAITAAGLLVFAIGPRAFRREVRKAVLPMVRREAWTAEEHHDHRERMRRLEAPPAGSLVVQAQQELARLTANTLALREQMIACDRQLEEIDRQARACTDALRVALAAGDGREAKRRASEAEVLERRTRDAHADRASLEALHATAQREVVEYEGTIADGMRRAAVAQARLSTARNSIRARQLADGPFRAEALARIDRAERDADLAEAAAEVLQLDTRNRLERDFAALRAQVAVDQPAEARRSTAA